MMRLILINTQEWLRLKFFHVVVFLLLVIEKQSDVFAEWQKQPSRCKETATVARKRACASK